MKMFFRIACLALLLSATRAQDFGLDLADVLDGDDKPPTPKPTPKKDDGFGLDLSVAFGDGEDTFANKPRPPPPSGGGGGGIIKDLDLLDIGGGDNYEPHGGKYNPDLSGGGGMDPNNNSGGDQPTKEDDKNCAADQEIAEKLTKIEQSVLRIEELQMRILNALGTQQRQ